MAWDTKKGRALSTLMLHVPVRGLAMATDASRIAVHLQDSSALPIICLHNTPASFVKMPSYIPPAKDAQVSAVLTVNFLFNVMYLTILA